jgi:hypothetical protein
VVEAPLGFLLQADLIVRLLTRENVGEVMDRLPPAFREPFVAFAREAYLPEDGLIVLAGEPMPAASLDAVRLWFRQADAGAAALHPLRAERFDVGNLWPDARAAYALQRADRATWAAEQEERRMWDVALCDGLEDDGYYAEAG